MKKQYYLPPAETKILLKKLQDYSNAGLSLSLNGKESSPAEITAACIMAEGRGFMPDYVSDDGKSIHKIDFIQIIDY